MLKFKKGDSVKITTGKDKGRQGKIERVLPKSQSVLIPGINVYKKHVKPSVAVDKKGGIYDIPRPLSFAKVALVCPKCKKQTRVRFKIVDNKKKRICSKCKKYIDSK